MRIDWKPSAISSGNIGTKIGAYRGVTAIYHMDDPNSFAPSSVTKADLLNRKDTRTEDPRKHWKIFRSCRAYSADQNVPWQNTTDYSSLQNNSLTQATTFIRFEMLNTQLEAALSPPVATMMVSWYIVFRG